MINLKFGKKAFKQKFNSLDKIVKQKKTSLLYFTFDKKTKSSNQKSVIWG